MAVTKDKKNVKTSKDTKRTMDPDHAASSKKKRKTGEARPKALVRSKSSIQRLNNKLFEDGVDSGLQCLSNALMRWEVARSFYTWAPEQQLLALGTNLGSDPGALDLNVVLPAGQTQIEDEFDPQFSALLSQLAHDTNKFETIISSGQVRFTISILLEPGDVLVIKLRPARLARSNQLTRKYGSDCLIQVKLSESVLHQIHRKTNRVSNDIGKAVWSFLSRPIRLAGRFYKAAIAKDNSVWFFSSPLNCSRPIEVTDLIEREIPLELNTSMKISKFNARLQLSLSNTSEAMVFKPEEIRRVPDIYSNSLRISKQLMARIAKCLKLSYIPTAIEGAHKAVGYVGQRYTWALFEPVLPEGSEMQLWNSDRVSNSRGELLTIEFVARVYIPALRRWEEKKCELAMPRARVKLITNKRQDDMMMTDGAAAISWGAALRIKDMLELKFLPAAYQARILKAKGLWYLSSEPEKDVIWIEIRASQWKAEVTCEPDELIPFSLCHHSTRARPGQVNRQSMPVLVSRNVPVKLFVDLTRANFQNALEDFTSTDSARLVNTLETSARLLPVRAERIATNVGSYKQQKDGPDVDEEETGGRYGCEKYSRRPLNPSEEAVELLKHGFEVRHHRVVELLVMAGKMVLDELVDFKLTIPLSVSVFVIPDPTGTLKEGEVFLQPSRIINPETGMSVPIVLGECVVSRSPCVHPSDARKVTAVNSCQLRNYTDVLVCSIVGDRSLLDYLSGGDYDGDTVNVIWDPRFTEPFTNADPVADSIPVAIYQNFFVDNTQLQGHSTKEGKTLPTGKVQDFWNLKQRSGTYQQDLRRSQLSALFQTVDFGRYAQMYKTCEYLLGVAHAMTKKMGYVYVKCLDAAKQGLMLKSEEDIKLRQEFDEMVKPHLPKPGCVALPPWTSKINMKKDFDKEWGFVSQDPDKKLYLPLNKKHVLEAISMALDQERFKFTFTLQTLSVSAKDPALSAPWESFQSRVKHNPAKGLALWKFMKANISKAYSEFREVVGKGSQRMQKPGLEKAWKTFWEDGCFTKAQEWVETDVDSKDILVGRGEMYYNLLKASGAASMMAERDVFAFHMAFDEVCFLKCRAVEQKHLERTGASLVNHVPRALAPDFNEALMSRST